MVDEKFVDERLRGAALVIQELESLDVPEGYLGRVADLGVTVMVAVCKREAEAVATVCWALFRLGYEAALLEMKQD